MQIAAGGVRREAARQRTDLSSTGDTRWRRRLTLSDEAKQLFGKAVDLYHSNRYAEALAIFDSFMRQFPGNPEIEAARAQCLNALKRPRLASRERIPSLSDEPKLDVETVKRVVLQKLLYGSTELIQIEAAKVACQILGLCGDGKSPALSETTPSEQYRQEAEAAQDSEISQEIKVSPQEYRSETAESSVPPNGLDAEDLERAAKFV